MPRLSTTSFALLGVLGRQAWSAYELTKFMRYSILRAIWPRAESHIYSECKNLREFGLVDATQQATGKRKRTEYTINKAGREALRQWLSEPVEARFLIESESLTKLVNAENRKQALALLRDFRQEAVQDADWTCEEVSRFVAGSQALPAGRDYNAMVTALLVDMMECRMQWANRMEALLRQQQATDDSRETLAKALYEEIESKLHSLAEA